MEELNGDEAGLVGYWKLNNSLLDETSNNNDLTNNNSATFSTTVAPIGGTIGLDTFLRGNSPTRGGTSETWSHTCTGDDRLLLVSICRDDDTTTAADDVTGVTYNSVAMTQLVKLNTSTTEPGVLYIYGLLAPATGANNIVVSLTGSTGSRAYCTSISYTGVSQSGLPDSTNTLALTSAATSQSISTTTVEDNSWVYAFFGQNGGSGDYSAGADTVLRSYCYTNNNERMADFDSNGAVITAGSRTLNMTNAVSEERAGVVVSFAPVVASGPANLKSYNGLAKASIKSINGLAIASIKSINSLE